jgi:hypothetical protein
MIAVFPDEVVAVSISERIPNRGREWALALARRHNAKSSTRQRAMVMKIQAQEKGIAFNQIGL